MERKIVLTRHLQTEYNIQGVNMGQIVDMGILREDEVVSGFKEKVNKMGKRLGVTEDNCIVISSPLKRCIETSRLSCEALNIPENILVIPELVETNMGDFSGIENAKLRERYGSLVDDWMYSPAHFRFPNGESYTEVRERVLAARVKIENNLKQFNLNFAFVCTHVDLVKMFITEALGVSFNTRRNFIIPNGSISLVGLLTDGSLRIEALNVAV